LKAVTGAAVAAAAVVTAIDPLARCYTRRISFGQVLAVPLVRGQITGFQINCVHLIRDIAEVRYQFGINLRKPAISVGKVRLRIAQIQVGVARVG